MLFVSPICVCLISFFFSFTRFRFFNIEFCIFVVVVVFVLREFFSFSSDYSIFFHVHRDFFCNYFPSFLLSQIVKLKTKNKTILFSRAQNTFRFFVEMVAFVSSCFSLRFVLYVGVRNLILLLFVMNC